MKMLHQGTIAALLLASACAPQDPTRDLTDAERAAVIEEQANQYAQALYDRDTATLEALLSSEVLARIDDTGIGLEGFTEKMRGSMIRQFGEMGPGPMGAFEVGDIQEEGDALRVSLGYQGASLEKPFYWVDEGGEYKLNVMRPGFSAPLPDGSLAATDPYLVKPINQQPGPEFWTLQCAATKSTYKAFTVPVGKEAKVNCYNTCGWWNGSTFHNPLSGRTVKCDWNSWGVDVWIDGYLGDFDCNDYC